MEAFVAVNTGYLETNIDSPEYSDKRASHLASQETLDSQSLEGDAASVDSRSLIGASEAGTEIILLDEEVQYVDIRPNQTSDIDRPADLPIKSKELTSPAASPTDHDLVELNSILLSPVERKDTPSEEKMDSKVLTPEDASKTPSDLSPSQSNDAQSPELEVVAKEVGDYFRSPEQTVSRDKHIASPVSSESEPDSTKMAKSREINIKSPDVTSPKNIGTKTPEMSSSPMDVDSLSSSYDRMVDGSGFSPSEKQRAMTPDTVSMEELSDPDKDQQPQSAKLGQRSRSSKPSTDSMASSGDELGQGKMDISFHSDKDVLEEDPFFMETTSKSTSSSVDSLDKGPGAPKSPKLEEEEGRIKAKVTTANKELLRKEPERLKTPERDVKGQKSSSVSPSSTTNDLVSPTAALPESHKPGPVENDLNETTGDKSADSSFVVRSAAEKEASKTAPVPKRKRSVKDLLCQFETLSQSPPKDDGGKTTLGQSPPPAVVTATESSPETASTTKARPAVFQKPKIVHLKTLSPSGGQDSAASDFSQTPQHAFQPKVPSKTITTTREIVKSKEETTTAPNVLSKPKDRSVGVPVLMKRDLNNRPVPAERELTNGQAMMSKSLDQSMLLKSLDSSNTTELTIDTSFNSDMMSRSVELQPSELNRERPPRPAKKLGHSPSFKERLRVYEAQREQKPTVNAPVSKPQTVNLNTDTTTNRSDRASSEESAGSVKNLSKMFERQNSTRSDGFSDRSRSVSREPEEPIKAQVASVETKPKVTPKGPQNIKKDTTKDKDQTDQAKKTSDAASSDVSPTKEKKSVKKLLGMFEQQGAESDAGPAAAEERPKPAATGKKPWTTIVWQWAEALIKTYHCVKFT